jgi:lipopolysaccharide/colanic/teichoic acid biosynthesis glycosyltransferase
MERPAERREADAFEHEMVDGPAQAFRHQVYLRVKATGEWATALLLAVLLSPVIAVLAFLVKATSHGPAFYLQTRLGRGGKTYRICKLRTMEHNCEGLTGPVWATKDDIRITRLGRVLRHTHLDELPQLWNVLRGDMGLIGPRPERPEIVARIEREVPGYRQRLQVLPGVTGLAQMRLPADTDVQSVRTKLAYDLFYVRQMSLMLDLRIAVCTAFYFLGATAQCVCNLAVGSYGRAVETTLEEEPTEAELIPEAAMPETA